MKSSNKSALNLKTQSYKNNKGKFQISKVTNLQSQIGKTNCSTRALLMRQEFFPKGAMTYRESFLPKELKQSFDLIIKNPW